MVIEDGSGLPLPGKGAKFRAVSIELAAYYDRRWPKSQPSQVWSDITGEPGRVHFRTSYESLGDFDREAPEWMADADFAALADRWFALMVPGSLRRTFSRVL